jgi:hypothetical protein
MKPRAPDLARIDNDTPEGVEQPIVLPLVIIRYILVYLCQIFVCIAQDR